MLDCIERKVKGAVVGACGCVCLCLYQREKMTRADPSACRWSYTLLFSPFLILQTEWLHCSLTHLVQYLQNENSVLVQFVCVLFVCVHASLNRIHFGVHESINMKSIFF